MDDKHLLDQARAWHSADPDPVTRDALGALIDAAEAAEAAEAKRDTHTFKQLRACFEAPLEFGTAGLRGLAGPGPANMNALLVQRVTAVMVDVLRAEVPNAGQRGVVIGYDARHGSKALAEAAAAVIKAAGVTVHVFDDYAPTPLVAFAALDLDAAAAIVLTASHNPPEYLGYKLYWSDGVQIVPPIDHRIAEALKALPLSTQIPADAIRDTHTSDSPDAIQDTHIHGEALKARYLEAILAGAPAAPAAAARAPTEGRAPSETPTAAPTKIVYTAMHGVAGELALRALKALNADTHTIEAQAQPDGDFPTVRFPNPEEPGAIDLALEKAKAIGADLVLANDPDGDRVAVAIPQPNGEWLTLMGDQTGLLLADFLLAEATSDEATSETPTSPSQTPTISPDRLFVLNTVVSSRLLARIAEAYGVGHEQTLTGFKWLWHRALQREARGERFVFAYEDAIGFCPLRAVHDKDGIATIVAIVRLIRDTHSKGDTLYDRLQALYLRYGLSITQQVSVSLSGAGATERMQTQLDDLRNSPPNAVAGLTLTALHDYAAAERRRPDGQVIEPIPLPTTNLIQLDLADPDTSATYHVSVRPSGTEPKLKLYLEYLGPSGTQDAGAAKLEEIADELMRSFS